MKTTCKQCGKSTRPALELVLGGLCPTCYRAAGNWPSWDQPCHFCGASTRYVFPALAKPICLLCAWIVHFECKARQILAPNDGD